MKKTRLLALLQELELRPSRRLGQNFLVDENLVRWLLASIDADAAGLIVEIGAGTGALTEGLLQRGGELVAVEYDYRLAAYLRQRYADAENLRLVEADACTVDFDALSGGRRFTCVGNLPYAVSSPLIARLLSVRNRPVRMVFTLQSETAERLAAEAGGRNYGALSVTVQSLYEVRPLRRLPPQVFWPIPKIDSAVLEMRLRAGAMPAADFGSFQRFVRAAFRHRRKKLLTCLAALPPGIGAAKDALAALEQPSTRRAQELSVPEFVALYRQWRQLAGQAGH